MMKRMLWTLLLLFTALLTACSAPEQPPAPEAGLTVSDMAGYAVELPGPAKTVVALNAGDVEIIYALAAEECLIGRGEFCDYPEQALELPQLQTGNDINMEQIVAMKPDAVIASAVFQNPEQVQRLRDAGIAVLMSDANSIDELYIAITMIGQLLGREEAAAELNTSLQSFFAGLQERAPEKGGSVYFEVSPLEWGLWAAGAGTFMDEIAIMLGLENAFGDINGWAEISEEQIFQRDPAYIVTVTMFYGDGPRPEEEIMSRPGWDGITAVKRSQVYMLDSDSITRPGPRLAEAAAELERYIYGE